MATALVAGDFHFLSDVLAGGFLGITVASFILGAWDFVRAKFHCSVATCSFPASGVSRGGAASGGPDRLADQDNTACA